MGNKNDKVTLYIPKELVRKARAKAIAQGTSLSAVVRRFIEEWVKDAPTKEEKQTPRG